MYLYVLFFQPKICLVQPLEILGMNWANILGIFLLFAAYAATDLLCCANRSGQRLSFQEGLHMSFLTIIILNTGVKCVIWHVFKCQTKKVFYIPPKLYTIHTHTYVHTYKQSVIQEWKWHERKEMLCLKEVH